jgi:hypothetical protein
LLIFIHKFNISKRERGTCQLLLHYALVRYLFQDGGYGICVHLIGHRTAVQYGYLKQTGIFAVCLTINLGGEVRRKNTSAHITFWLGRRHQKILHCICTFIQFLTSFFGKIRKLVCTLKGNLPWDYQSLVFFPSSISPKVQIWHWFRNDIWIQTKPLIRFFPATDHQ